MQPGEETSTAGGRVFTAHNGRRRCARAPFTQRVRRDFDGALVVEHVPHAVTCKHEKEVVPHDWWQQDVV